MLLPMVIPNHYFPVIGFGSLQGFAAVNYLYDAAELTFLLSQTTPSLPVVGHQYAVSRLHGLWFIGLQLPA
jgi:hypothetical protein